MNILTAWHIACTEASQIELGILYTRNMLMF